MSILCWILLAYIFVGMIAASASPYPLDMPLTFGGFLLWFFSIIFLWPWALFRRLRSGDWAKAWPPWGVKHDES